MAKYRILVIDDTRVIRLSLKSILEKIGAEVLELNSADDLFQSSWRFLNLDLIFLDIDLPGMNGMTALIKIKEDPKWTNVPIIMLTSLADPDIVKRAIQAGIVDYVRKPFMAEALLNRVKTLLSMTEDPSYEVPDDTADLPTDIAPSEPPAWADYEAVITLEPTATLPSGLASLFRPDSKLGLQLTNAAILTLPFQFAGSPSEAARAIEQHLKKIQLPVNNCKITPQ